MLDIRQAFRFLAARRGVTAPAVPTLSLSSVATTEIYTHVLDERLKALVLTHHPLARS